MDGFPAELSWLTALLGHELGHTWGTGAALSWEDWLNETVAEWSCLCYLRERCGEAEFRSELERNCRECGQYPPIRTLDGSRPDGVHQMGTALFAWIEQKTGLETVKQMLRVYAGMAAPKTTEGYLASLETELGTEVAGWLRSGLDHTEFLKELSFIAE